MYRNEQQKIKRKEKEKAYHICQNANRADPKALAENHLVGFINSSYTWHELGVGFPTTLGPKNRYPSADSPCTLLTVIYPLV